MGRYANLSAESTSYCHSKFKTDFVSDNDKQTGHPIHTLEMHLVALDQPLGNHHSTIVLVPGLRILKQQIDTLHIN
jgi:hypothetical protein